MDLSPEALRARFADLCDQRQAKLDASGPLRDQRDTLIRTSSVQVAALDAQIATAEDGLGDIAQEMAMISRALGGRTGDPATNDDAA
jgi:hypothetical protein